MTRRRAVELTREARESVLFPEDLAAWIEKAMAEAETGVLTGRGSVNELIHAAWKVVSEASPQSIAELRSALLGHDAVPMPAVPMILTCPACRARHVDRGEFETKPHHTHACQECGMTWRPAIGPTVGVQFLPGFKDPVPGPRPLTLDVGGLVFPVDEEGNVTGVGTVRKMESR